MLSGIEVRPVQRGQERLKEAAKLGFTLAIVPKGNVPKRNTGKESVQGIEIVAVDRVDQAIERVR